jgi:hypothetical protein
MPSTRTFFLVFLIALLAASGAHALRFTGILNDPEFSGRDSLQIEVVENGALSSIAFAKSFQLDLPQDTLWNLCVRADSLEKCYELLYLGKDSSFAGTLSGAERITWYDDGSVERAEAKPDTAALDSSAGVDVDSLLKAQESSVTELRKVVVQLRKKPKRKIGESVVSAKSIKRMPGLAEADVIRSIQALPGVVASSDFSTKIYVRGGGADQNLFLLDNGVVFSPTHFFGLFSTFLVETVDDVKFYKSGFQPEYGNRLSSVAAINSRSGGQDTVDEWFSKNSVKISTFATQAHTEGHQGNARWVIAGRSTYIKQVLDALKAADAIDFTLDYKFTDLQGVFDYHLGEGRDVRASIYTGSDVLNFDPFFIDWGNTVVPVNLKWRINEYWDWRSTLAYSYFFQTFEMTDIFAVKNNITTFASKQALTFNDFVEHTPTMGYDLEYSKVTFIQDAQISKQYYEDTNRPWHHIFYLQDVWRIPEWEFQYGLRFNYHSLSEHFGTEPRFSTTWNFAENQTLNFHLGYYLQYLNSIQFSDQETINEFYYPSRTATVRDNLLPTSSILTSLGYTRDRLFEDWTFNTEVYYKTLDHLLVFAPNELSDSLSAKATSLADYFKEGEGYSFGYEASLRKAAGTITGGLSWSQGWSVVKEQNDPLAYYPDWHQPYALKADLAVNWRGEDGLWAHPVKGRYFRSSAQLKYSSGLPFTEYLGYHSAYDIDQSYPGYTVGGSSEEHPNNTAVPMGNRNTAFQPAYFRLDLKPIDIGREGKWSFSWTILNVTGHENVFMYQYDTSKNPPELVQTNQFPFFPLLVNYEYYF